MPQVSKVVNMLIDSAGVTRRGTFQLDVLRHAAESQMLKVGFQVDTLNHDGG